jgi:hypothetical protein
LQAVGRLREIEDNQYELQEADDDDVNVNDNVKRDRKRDDKDDKDDKGDHEDHEDDEDDERQQTIILVEEEVVAIVAEVEIDADAVVRIRAMKGQVIRKDRSSERWEQWWGK